MSSNQQDRFNLSKWAIENQAITRYMMIALLVLGVGSYFQLGQDEDPPFTFRAMVIKTNWPGATAVQVADQVTNKIERTLQEVPSIDKIRSFSHPGESMIIFFVKDSHLSFTSSTPAPALVSGDSLVWTYSNLLINEFRTITLHLQADTTITMGDTLHSSWTIHPLTLSLIHI